MQNKMQQDCDQEDKKTTDYPIVYYFLFAPLLVAAALAWIFPIAPAGDGPYQTLNWVARVKMGQLPGRDFDVFHGIGVLWYHAVLAFPFDSARSIIWIHYVGSLFAQFLLWTFVLKELVQKWTTSIVFGAGLISALLLTSGIPKANFALFCTAGHSMIGARVALPLMMLMLSWRFGTEKCIVRALVFGLGAGISAWISTDQALASIGMSAVMILVSSFTSKGRKWLNIIKAAWFTLLGMAVALWSYFLLLTISSGGSAERAISYWWKILPTVQFWYFGGAPNPYIHHLSDIRDVSVVLPAGAAFFLHIIGFVWRKPGQWGLRLGLLAYGLISMLPLLGMYFPHYLSGLWCTGLIALIYCEFPGKFLEECKKLSSFKALRILFAVGSFLLIILMIQVQFENRDRYKNPEKLEHTIVNKDMDFNRSPLPDFVQREIGSHHSENFLRAFYRSVPEISLNKSGVGRYDYIIHALGAQQQKEYRDTMENAPTLFLRVPCQKDFSYTQWIWHHWPELWTGILSRYDMVGIHDGSAYWRCRDSRKTLEYRKLDVTHVQDAHGVTIRTDAVAQNQQIWRVRITYSTKPVDGMLGKPMDRLTRVTVTPIGTIDNQPFSWGPGELSQVHELLILPRIGSEIELKIEGEGFLWSSGFLLESVELEECIGSDVDGVVRMLER